MEAQEQTQPGVRKVEETPADNRRGGDVRTLLSPKTRRLHARASWASPPSPPATGSRSTTTRTRRSSSTSVRGHAHRRSRRRAADRERRARRSSSRSTSSTACATRATRRPSSSSTSARWPRGRTWATSTPRSAILETERGHRGRGRRAGRREPGGVLGAASRPARRRRARSRSSIRPASARRSPPRPTSTRSEAGLNDQEVRRMDRYVQFAVAAAMEAVTDAGLDLDEVDRERMAVTLGSAVGGTMVLEDDYVVGHEPRREVARRPRVRAAVPLPRARPEQPGGRGRAQVRRPRAVGRRLHRLHVRASTRSATATS